MSNNPIADDGTLDLYALFSTNVDAEEEGRWIDLTDKTKFKIRAMGCKAVLDLREELMKQFQPLLRAGLEVPEDKNLEMGRRILAGAVIADWSGVKVGGEDAVPYSAEAAYELLKALPRLAGWIAGQSGEAQNFKDVAKVEATGN